MDGVDKFYRISIVKILISKIDNNTPSMVLKKKKIGQSRGVINGTYLYHGFYLSALKSSKVSFFKQNLVNFPFSKFEIGAFKVRDQKQSSYLYKTFL